MNLDGTLVLARFGSPRTSTLGDRTGDVDGDLDEGPGPWRPSTGRSCWPGSVHREPRRKARGRVEPPEPPRPGRCSRAWFVSVRFVGDLDDAKLGDVDGNLDARAARDRGSWPGSVHEPRRDARAGPRLALGAPRRDLDDGNLVQLGDVSNLDGDRTGDARAGQVRFTANLDGNLDDGTLVQLGTVVPGQGRFALP